MALLALTGCARSSEPALGRAAPTSAKPGSSASRRVASAPRSTAPPSATSASAEFASADDDDTSGVVGHVPAEWQASHWFNSPPLTLGGLRGRVVFVRWFTSPSCPFCSASAPALRTLFERYEARGLTVVGMYHHKGQAPLNPADVRGWAKHYGYDFPVAIDDDWKTLKRWWLTGHPNRGYTSVSFLIDKSGVVRRVHLGGLIELDSPEFRDIDADVQRLLAEAPG